MSYTRAKKLVKEKPVKENLVVCAGLKSGYHAHNAQEQGASYLLARKKYTETVDNYTTNQYIDNAS